MTNAIASQVLQTVKAQETRKRAAAKPAAKKATATKTARKPVSKIKHFLVTGRPVSGANLQAFTAAWMSLTGMDKGKAVEKALIEKVAGATAIAYHVKTGRLQNKDGLLSLTDGGKLHFQARQPEEETVKAWQSILTTGKPDGKMIKNAAMIAAI